VWLGVRARLWLGVRVRARLWLGVIVRARLWLGVIVRERLCGSESELGICVQVEQHVYLWAVISECGVDSQRKCYGFCNVYTHIRK
jgi:hypothetical protein